MPTSEDSRQMANRTAQASGVHGFLYSPVKISNRRLTNVCPKKHRLIILPLAQPVWHPLGLLAALFL
jgi:hypothetical protein